ncbi:GNAT family N-acetyltransferase [Pseudonocardia zijingensis]|uniref:GNAT family N-acetyltransferase n=1 Tax=Pseudonocardia zijingensis TaxID=153376 RepID=UPI0031E469B3
MPHPLDNPAMAALLGPHAHFAERIGRVLRYPPDVSPFAAMPPEPAPADWVAATELVGPGGSVTVSGPRREPPPGWEVLFEGEGVQLVDDGVTPAPAPDAVVLGAADVPEMLALVERTDPGPFRPRTVELGTYLGIRRDGELVAMAGERLHPPGWTEISAVCTAPEHRGHGLATTLVRALVHGIRARGETPFLHAAGTNVTAIRLYESLGFRLRRRTTFAAFRAPALAEAS